MLDVHGFVNTTNACNFFIVRKGEVWTSHRRLLHERHHPRQGDRRSAAANGIPVFEKQLQPRRDLFGADEAFLTGTFGAQTPVGTIDGRQIGTRPDGPDDRTAARRSTRRLVDRGMTRHARIAMWSGPAQPVDRDDVAFAARGDCAVWDEPFYAAYLAATGIDHPMRAEIIAAQRSGPGTGRRRLRWAGSAGPEPVLPEAHDPAHDPRLRPRLDCAACRTSS